MQEKKIKAFENMISNIIAQKEILEQQISEVRKQLNTSPDASNDELIEKLTQQNALLKDVTAKLNLRRKDLDNVKKQLLETQQEKLKKMMDAFILSKRPSFNIHTLVSLNKS